MEGFLKWLDKLTNDFPIHIEIGYNKITDWNIYIYKRGCASMYPDSRKDGEDAIMCGVQDCDIELAFAKAQCEVKEWLCEHNGGY